MDALDRKQQVAFERITEAGIRMAFAPNAAGIAQGWALRLKGRIKFTTAIETWAIDGDGVWINPDFTATLSTGQIMFTVGHEFLHYVLDHYGLGVSLGVMSPSGEPVEGRERDLEIFRTAVDIVDNELLIRDRIGDPVSGILTLAKDGKGYTGDLDAAALYYYLKDQEPPPPPPQPNPEPNPDPNEGEDEGESGSGEGEGEQGEGQDPGEGAPNEPQPGRGCVPHGHPGQSQKARDEQEAKGQPPPLPPSAEIEELRTLLQKSAGVGTAIAEILTPRPRRATLRELLQEGASNASAESSSRTRPTYSRISRREPLDPEILRPGYIGDDPSLCVVIDVSGSVAREFVEAGASIAQSIAEEFPSLRLYFVTHTSDVCWSGWIREGGDPATIAQATGFSGGTDPVPAYKDARLANGDQPFDSLVHITDCEFNEWPEVPAKHLIVGVCGAPSLALDPDALYTKPPEGAVLIPVQEGES